MDAFYRRIAVSAGTVVFILGVLAVPKTSTAATFDPITAYGPEIVFDVYRKGERIGLHRVAFRRDNGVLIAESRFAITITILGLPVYNYEYTSTGRWRHGRLLRLEARTDDDGAVSEVYAERNNGRLKVRASGVQSVAPADLYPTTHWNPGVIGATQVLNTITGHINTVRMRNLGTDDVVTGASRRMARHFVYEGDLETEVWYDMRGRWVKMRFAGKDGVPIEYRCRLCGGMPPDFETDAGKEQGML